jgi:hypothetical protein
MNCKLILLLIYLCNLKKIYSKCNMGITSTPYIPVTSTNFFHTTVPITASLVHFTTLSILSSAMPTTKINIKTTTSKSPILASTPTPVLHLNCSIFYNTFGIYDSGQSHATKIFYDINNVYDCCEKCQSYLTCTIFIFVNPSQQCFIYTVNKKIIWSNIKFLPSNDVSIGRLV